MIGTFHIVLAMKPTQGNFAENALAFGVAGINVDGIRIQSPKGDGVWGTSNSTINTERKFNASPGMTEYRSERNVLGRFPSNVILSHAEGCVLKGTRTVRGRRDEKPIEDEGRQNKAQWRFRPTSETSRGYADEEGNETVEDWECVESCPVRKLGEQSGERPTGALYRVNTSIGGSGIYQGGAGGERNHPADTGTAARFFYTVKEFVIYDKESD